MTVVRHFKVHSRLRAALLNGKGLRVKEALDRVDEGLRGLADECAETVRALVADIQARFGQGVATRGDEQPIHLYMLTARIIESAIGEKDAPLVEAAGSLCDVLDICDETGVWDWPAVDVHLDALKLLTLPGGLPAEASAMLVEQLRAVSRHREAARG